MKNRIKKTSAVIAAVLAIAMLAACSDKNDNPNGNSTVRTPSKSTAQDSQPGNSESDNSGETSQTGNSSALGENGFEYKYDDKLNGVIITQYTGDAADVKIPENLEGKPVVCIGKNSFYGNENLTSVTIPGSVTQIRESAFQNCSNLTSITIPNGVTEIEESAFEGCHSLTNVSIPESIIEIKTDNYGLYPFDNCENLTSITVSEGNSRYFSVDGVLYEKGDNNKVTLCVYPIGKSGNAVIPDNVTALGLTAFWGCTKLKDVTIPDGVIEIGTHAFTECTGISITYKNKTYDFNHLNDLKDAINGN